MAGNVKWYGDRLIKKVAASAGAGMEAACILVNTDAKRICPFDTSRLKNSLTWEIEKKKNEIIGRVGTNVEYAVYVEYGTSKMSAQPYLRPALEKNKAKIKRLLGGK